MHLAVDCQRCTHSEMRLSIPGDLTLSTSMAETTSSYSANRRHVSLRDICGIWSVAWEKIAFQSRSMLCYLLGIVDARSPLTYDASILHRASVILERDVCGESLQVPPSIVACNTTQHATTSAELKEMLRNVEVSHMI